MSISRALDSPEPELQLSLSPASDLDGGYFPPTPRGCHTPRSHTGTVCTPENVRRLSATQNLDMDLQDSPKGIRQSRRGGMCAFYDNQVPESIRSIRTTDFFETGGDVCPEEGRPTSHQRIRSVQFNWTPHALESISSEVLTPKPLRSLRRTRSDYITTRGKRSARRSIVHAQRFLLSNIGGSQIP